MKIPSLEVCFQSEVSLFSFPTNAWLKTRAHKVHFHYHHHQPFHAMLFSPGKKNHVAEKVIWHWSSVTGQKRIYSLDNFQDKKTMRRKRIKPPSSKILVLTKIANLCNHLEENQGGTYSWKHITRTHFHAVCDCHWATSPSAPFRGLSKLSTIVFKNSCTSGQVPLSMYKIIFSWKRNPLKTPQRLFPSDQIESFPLWYETH